MNRLLERFRQWRDRPVDPRKGVFIIIKSAEGKRTSAHKYISAEQYEIERAKLEKAGLKRIKRVF